jgi:hypothetical protein
VAEKCRFAMTGVDPSDYRQRSRSEDGPASPVLRGCAVPEPTLEHQPPSCRWAKTADTSRKAHASPPLASFIKSLLAAVYSRTSRETAISPADRPVVSAMALSKKANFASVLDGRFHTRSTSY